MMLYLHILIFNKGVVFMVKKLRLNEDFEYGTKVVLSNELFDLVEVISTDINDKPYNMLECRSKGLAKKYSVQITVQDDFMRKNREPDDITFCLYEGAWIGCGGFNGSSKSNQVDDVIYCLQEARNFVNDIERYVDKVGRWA